MATSYERPLMVQLKHDLSALRGNWFWFVLVGIALVVLGAVVLSCPFTASLATAVVIGAVLVASGIFESIGAFWAREWSGFFFVLLEGILSVVVGVLFLRTPGESLMALTLLIACFLMVSGIFKMVAAAVYRFGAWGWPFLGGLVDVLLGSLILSKWPTSALWVIGLFVGINLVFRGANWISLGLALRRLIPANR